MLDAIRKLDRGAEIRLPDGVARVLHTTAEVEARIAELGRQLAADYAGRVPILVAILRGGFVFQCDLARAADIPQEVDFLSLSRFGPDDKSRASVKVLHDLRSDIRRRHVVVVEGIRTASTKTEYLKTFLSLREPASICFAALVHQGDGRNQGAPLQYGGFDVGEEFVIGYGLDYGERYRNLPVIAAFRPHGTRV